MLLLDNKKNQRIHNDSYDDGTLKQTTLHRDVIFMLEISCTRQRMKVGVKVIHKTTYLLREPNVVDRS